MATPTDQSGDLFERRGISLSTYSESGYTDSSVTDMIHQAVRTGANYVVLGNIKLADLSTGAIGDVIEDGRNQTASMASVARAVAQAEAAGLNVVLKPQIAVHDAAYDQYNSASWINMVNPDLPIGDPAKFFASYKTMLMGWAELAQRQHVDTLCIGNEMVAATKPEYTAYWDDIIAAVRSVYDGKLTYAALAPVMTNSASNEITQIGFWDKLDYAGFDVYPSLYHGTSPTVADLNAGWHDTTVYGHQQDYVAFLNDMAAFVGKPVVFTETGLPSFDGASDREATSDGTIGNGTRADDQAEQADWWQSFFETWAAAKPAWLKGVYVTNNDPGNLGSYYDQNYNINGKLAEPVVAAWFGGHTDLNASLGHVSGSQAADQIYLYDPGVAATGIDLAAHSSTTVRVTVTAGIVDGQVPTIHAYVNGTDFGQIALQPFDSGYVASDGTHWTTNATYAFSLPGLVSVDELKLAFDSPAMINGHRSQTFFQSVSINGVALATASYVPAPGSGGPYAEALPVDGQGGSTSQWNGGYTLFDATPWNKALAHDVLGTAGDPIMVDGGAGIDTVRVLGAAQDYTLLRNADGSIDLSETHGLNQNAHLTNVERLAFADGVTLDLNTLKPGEHYSPTAKNVPAFDAATYLASYADLRAAFGTDLSAAARHWIDYGIAEGRNPNLFDAAAYAAAHPEAVAAVGTSTSALAGYFDTHVASFDAATYLASYADLRAAFGTDLSAAARHWINYGIAEGRDPNLFDAAAYAAAHPEAVAAVGTATSALAGYYVAHPGGSGFDPLEYAATNPDVAIAFGDNQALLTQHYLTYGIAEHRQTSGFDAVAYLLSNADLERAGVGVAGALHEWVTSGARSGSMGDSWFGREQQNHDLTVGGTVSAGFGKPGDHDWFQVELTAGRTIDFDVSASAAVNLALYDSHGHLVSTGMAGHIEYQAASEGTYYLAASAQSDQASFAYQIATGFHH